MKLNNKTLTILWVALILLGTIFIFCSTKESAVAEDGFAEPVSDKVVYSLPEMPWYKMGYSSVKEYWDDISAKREEAKGVADEAIEKYSSVITDEQEQQLRDYEKKMLNAVYLADYEKAAAEFDAVAAECQAKMPKYTYNSSYNYPSGNGVLTMSGGVNWFNGNKETWYSQKVLPGEGLTIPGRHVAEDGTIRDKDGYICVAMDGVKKGSTIETSLGMGKVYDRVSSDGSRPGIVDIYVNW